MRNVQKPREKKVLTADEIGEDFMTMFCPLVKVKIMGQELYIRTLAVVHYKQLRTEYPEWTSMDVMDLINLEGYEKFDILTDIIWSAIDGIEASMKIFPTWGHLQWAINGDSFSDWFGVFYKTTGTIPPQRDVAPEDDEGPEKNVNKPAIESES